MVIAHAAIASWHHFHPWITKNMDLETISNFAMPSHRKSQNCTQSGSQEAPKIHPKIDKSGHLLLSVSIGCPLDLRIIKMVSQVSKEEPQGPKNGSFR